MDRSPDQDRDDVARVLAGDVEAFSGIVHRWQGPLVTLAFRFCRHPARAEELAQEAFLRAYRRLGQWRGDAAFSTWLFAVATNVYRSDVRRVRPQEVALQETDGMPGDGDVLASIEAGEQAEIVRRTVGTLPRRYRDAVVLYYFSDMDVACAARSLGVPTGTVKARLHRARRGGRDAGAPVSVGPVWARPGARRARAAHSAREFRRIGASVDRAVSTTLRQPDSAFTVATPCRRRA